MVFQYICLTALIAVASAQYQVGYPVTSAYRPSGYKPAAYKPAAYKPAAYQPAPYAANYEGPSDYNFNYEVNDPTTYDVKSQSEYSKDGYVAGSYSLIDADGLRRTVDYTADDYNGFQATVRREQVGYGYGQNYNGYPSYPAKSGYAPSYKPGTYPASYSASYPAAYPAKYPATYPATYPASYPATYSASYPATYPVSYPAVYPAKYPATYPASYPITYPAKY